MLSPDLLKQVIHLKGLTKTDQLLLCLAVDKNAPKSVPAVRDLAINAGVPGVKKWNVGAFLSGSRGKAIKTPDGFELGPSGVERVREIIGPHMAVSPPKKVSLDLRNLLPKLKNADTQAFVEETISCFETKLYRAAVVLSWVGALSVIYEYVVANRLTDFNAEAQRRDAKWRPAKTADDLARMKEHDFLQVAEAISIIGKSVKGELENCLKLRNGCGHPNSLKIGPTRVESHMETLILNVFTVFV